MIRTLTAAATALAFAGTAFAGTAFTAKLESPMQKAEKIVAAKATPVAATDEDESKAGADAISEADRFRSYQSGQWSTRFRELCEYKEKNGHCLVPHNFSENLALARWVKRQRCQYRRMKEGQHSTSSDDRKKALDDIGFV